MIENDVILFIVIEWLLLCIYYQLFGCWICNA